MNEGLARYFEAFAAERKSQGKESNAKALTASANIIRSFPVEIKDVSQLEGVKGIGPKSKFYVKTYLEGINKGTITVDPSVEVIKLFETIYGIGEVKARYFFDKGYRTLQDLWNSNELPEPSRLYLQFYNDLQLRIPYQEIQYIESVIRSNIPSNIHWIIAGSYRRKEPTSGDIDILIRDINISEFINPLITNRVIYGQYLIYGDQVFNGLAKATSDSPVRRIDVKVVPAREWATATLHYTGSVTFNKLLREQALKRGYTVNEHRILNSITKEEYYPNSEEEIFSGLNLMYVPPEQRGKDLKYLHEIPQLPQAPRYY